MRGVCMKLAKERGDEHALLETYPLICVFSSGAYKGGYGDSSACATETDKAPLLGSISEAREAQLHAWTPRGVWSRWRDTGKPIINRVRYLKAASHTY